MLITLLKHLTRTHRSISRDLLAAQASLHHSHDWLTIKLQLYRFELNFLFLLKWEFLRSQIFLITFV